MFSVVAFKGCRASPSGSGRVCGGMDACLSRAPCADQVLGLSSGRKVSRRSLKCLSGDFFGLSRGCGFASPGLLPARSAPKLCPVW